MQAVYENGEGVGSVFYYQLLQLGFKAALVVVKLKS